MAGAGGVGRQRLRVIRLDPDQTNSDQFILTCYIFWIFVFSMILTQNTFYCVASYANALIAIEYDFMPQYIYSVFGSV